MISFLFSTKMAHRASMYQNLFWAISEDNCQLLYVFETTRKCLEGTMLSTIVSKWNQYETISSKSVKGKYETY